MFVPVPGRIAINNRPAISPQTLPQTQLQVDPIQGGNQAQIRTNNRNANVPNENTRPSGQRVGGRVNNRRVNNNNRPIPVAPIMRVRNGDRRNNNSNLNVVAGDFGFNIDGSKSPNIYQGHHDLTLFRDYNKNSVRNPDTGLNQNNYTNAIKMLTINFGESIDGTSGYFDAFNIIQNKIERSIIASTKASKGALDIITGSNVRKYLDTVIQAYDFLIELEVMQAWDPESNRYYDKTLRGLASSMSVANVLETRNQLRMALIPHVLPMQWMQYIKWLRETKLQNEVP
jgi:hypothetical protein